ncbi:hypothetical protein I553_10283 [Mycobacterium xenopi 4042]|uniref:Uncharacterized protein n=1 Tax=Mycobacterium xenopi 4042 TaxID=1299334 RepID=X8APA9_MYCXE|nr:hypothetical protein I553_10283 [Mycobacterium xenopi 4042]
MVTTWMKLAIRDRIEPDVDDRDDDGVEQTTGDPERLTND